MIELYIIIIRIILDFIVYVTFFVVGLAISVICYTVVYMFQNHLSRILLYYSFVTFVSYAVFTFQILLTSVDTSVDEAYTKQITKHYLRATRLHQLNKTQELNEEKPPIIISEQLTANFLL